MAHRFGNRPSERVVHNRRPTPAKEQTKKPLMKIIHPWFYLLLCNERVLIQLQHC